MPTTNDTFNIKQSKGIVTQAENTQYTTKKKKKEEKVENKRRSSNTFAQFGFNVLYDFLFILLQNTHSTGLLTLECCVVYPAFVFDFNAKNITKIRP